MKQSLLFLAWLLCTGGLGFLLIREKAETEKLNTQLETMSAEYEIFRRLAWQLQGQLSGEVEKCQAGVKP